MFCAVANVKQHQFPVPALQDLLKFISMEEIPSDLVNCSL
jgi:hypothetical protein